MIAVDFVTAQSPYYDMKNEDDEDEKLLYREDYVQQCLDEAMYLWNKFHFSDDLTVIFEDKFDCMERNENKIVENTLSVCSYEVYQFTWKDNDPDFDDDEIYTTVRYIWKTNAIKVEELFRRIILSDLGEKTILDQAVYIIDNKTEEVFWLFDDRGMNIYYGEK